jgi:hypothetical protein
MPDQLRPPSTIVEGLAEVKSRFEAMRLALPLARKILYAMGEKQAAIKRSVAGGETKNPRTNGI